MDPDGEKREPTSGRRCHPVRPAAEAGSRVSTIDRGGAFPSSAKKVRWWMAPEVPKSREVARQPRFFAARPRRKTHGHEHHICRKISRAGGARYPRHRKANIQGSLRGLPDTRDRLDDRFGRPHGGGARSSWAQAQAQIRRRRAGEFRRPMGAHAARSGPLQQAREGRARAHGAALSPGSPGPVRGGRSVGRARKACSDNRPRARGVVGGRLRSEP